MEQIKSGNISFVSGQLELLDIVKPLWEKLNNHHSNVNKSFSESIKKRSFETRAQDFLDRAPTQRFRVEVAYDSGKNEYIGYCISSVSDKNVGEIDSIFIDETYRGKGVGSRFMESALEWMDKSNVKSKRLSVIYGNDSALRFYAKYGFNIRSLILEQQK
ncbi:MAG: GNAT family N-acetyltransferase [Bacillota bacterium]|nr:GNAT family N-acetyltransferase [Bacillota bacterium]